MPQERFDLDPQIGPLSSGEVLTAFKTVDIEDCIPKRFDGCMYLLRYVEVEGNMWARFVCQDGLREVFAENVELLPSSNFAATSHSHLTFYTHLCGISLEQLHGLIHEHAPRPEHIAA